MKYALGLLTLAFLLPPAAALADDTPASPAPPGASAPAAGHRGFSDRRHADRAQFERIRLRERAQILAALSSGHRALLANVVGQLAIAPNPDPRAAAARLDAALSPAETRTILAADKSAHEQFRSLLQSTHEWGPPPSAPGGEAGPMNGPGPAAGGPGGPGGPGGLAGGPRGPGGPDDGHWQHMGHHLAPDAGRILLHLASFAPPGPDHGPGAR
jgi:hypothetical protein